MVKHFDLEPIVTDSDVILKGFRFRKRELALGGVLVVCFLVIIILAALLASANKSSDGGTPCIGDAGAQKGNGTETAHVLDLLNTTVSPCEDFHKYACGRFPELNPLEPDEAEVSTFWNIHNKNQDRIRILLEKPPIDNNVKSYDRKLKDFFSSCQDHFYKMQQRGRPLLDKVLRKLPGGWWALGADSEWDDTTWDLNAALKVVHVDYWTDAFFTFSIITDKVDWRKNAITIDLSGTGMVLGYYNASDSRFEKPRTDYKTFIQTVGSLLLRDAELGITDAEMNQRVETFVQDAFGVETEIAKLKENAESTPNPHSLDQRMTLQQINDQTGGAVDWVGFFTYMFDSGHVTNDTKVVVLEKKYVLKLAEWIQNGTAANPREFKRKLHNYMVWRLAHRYVQDLSWEYIHANRQIYVDITGVAEFLGTWRYCVNKIDRDMYEALGALFVRDHFSDANKEKAHEITDLVKTALINRLQNSTHWMSAQTRQTAVDKLRDSLIKLGYPNFMMDEDHMNGIYSILMINKTDYFGNLLSFNKFFKQHWNDYLSHIADTSDWRYATYTFVAHYYNPWKELIVPAGMLQFPIYDHTSPNYMNFGSMGAIVGRQLVHAVDEIANSYKVDGSGTTDDGSWWSNQTVQAYRTVKKCIQDAYANATQVDMEYYTPLALGESSGIKLAYSAYKDWMRQTGGEKKMPGSKWTNEQSFFVAYAQVCRVNKALAQLQEFQDAFQCSSTSKMVAPTRCQLY
nr:hypothetical protein BaRGS_034573 [Batillaria attramentaria]